MNTCKYGKCNGSGLIPFRNKEDKIVNHTFLFCECHPVYGDDAIPSIPLVTQGRRPGIGSRKLPRPIPRGRMHLYVDDFDFPMSYSFYRSLCREHGWTDPGDDRMPEEPKEEIISQPRPIVNVTYNIDAKNTPAFKALEDRISLMNGRISKYFEGKKKGKDKYKTYT